MKAVLRRMDHVAVYTLRGDFDATVLEPFHREIERVLAQGVTTLVIDARAIRFISSSGLRALVEARRRCRERGGELTLAQPSPAVRHLVGLLGLGHVLLTAEEEPALAAGAA